MLTDWLRSDWLETLDVAFLQFEVWNERLTDWLRSDLRLFVRMCRRSFFIGSAIDDGLAFGMEGQSGPTQKSRSNEGVIGQT